MSRQRLIGLSLVASVLLSSAARAVVVAAGDAQGEPGETVEIAVVLDTGGEPVAGIQNDLEVTPPLHFGDADCTVNPAIGKSGFFNILPCDRGGGCERLRALVLSLDGVGEIPDGAVLYRCRITIDNTAPGGVYPVLVTNSGAADPDGNALLANGFAGRVVVGGPPGAVVQIDDAVIPIGEFVPIRVRLAGDSAATTVTNDITLSEAVHITSNVEDQPSCTASVPDVAATFEFLPAGCATVRDECTTMRASITASEPLPLAVPLYECTVFPVPVIDPGTYVIDCPAATATDADGAPLPIACQSALVRILPYELPPTATPTPTGAVPSGSPPAAQVTPTFTAALRRTTTAPAPLVASNEADGCQVGAPTGPGAFVALLGPALLLAWKTRRRRDSAPR